MSIPYCAVTALSELRRNSADPCTAFETLDTHALMSERVASSVKRPFSSVLVLEALLPSVDTTHPPCQLIDKTRIEWWNRLDECNLFYRVAHCSEAVGGNTQKRCIR